MQSCLTGLIHIQASLRRDPNREARASMFWPTTLLTRKIFGWGDRQGRVGVGCLGTNAAKRAQIHIDTTHPGELIHLEVTKQTNSRARHEAIALRRLGMIQLRVCSPKCNREAVPPCFSVVRRTRSSAGRIPRVHPQSPRAGPGC